MSRFLKVSEIQGNWVNKVPYNREIKVLASPFTNLNTKYFAVGMSIIPPGNIHERHFHKKVEEVIYVVAGSGEAYVDKDKFKIEEGIFIRVRPGEVHEFHNKANNPLRLLWIYAPPGEEKKFLS